MKLFRWVMFVVAGAILLTIFSFGFDSLWDCCVAIGGIKGFVLTEIVFAVVPALTIIALVTSPKEEHEQEEN